MFAQSLGFIEIKLQNFWGSSRITFADNNTLCLNALQAIKKTPFLGIPLNEAFFKGDRIRLHD